MKSRISAIVLAFAVITGVISCQPSTNKAETASEEIESTVTTDTIVAEVAIDTVAAVEADTTVVSEEVSAE